MNEMDSQANLSLGRDFLAEAARLAGSLDPASPLLDFEAYGGSGLFVDGRENQSAAAVETTMPYPDHFSNGTAILKDPLMYPQSQQIVEPISTDFGLQMADHPHYTHLNLAPNVEGFPPVPSSSSGSDLEKGSQAQSVSDTNTSGRQTRLSVKMKRQQPNKQKDDRGVTESLQREVAQLRREKAMLESHADVLEKALMKMSVDNSKVQTKEDPVFMPSMGWTSFDPKANVILNALFDPPKRITYLETGRITLREYGQLWRAYLAAVKEVLPKVDKSDPQNVHSQRLQALLSERHGFLSYMSASHPSMAHQLLTHDMSTDPPQPIDPDNLRLSESRILEKLELSEDQVEFLIQTRNQFLLSTGYHFAALRKLQETFAASDPLPLESLRNTSYLTWLRTMKSLQETIEEIHVSNCAFHMSLYKCRKGLSEYQKAVLMLESYPYLPDVVALLRVLALQRQQPPSEEMFRTGAAVFAEEQRTKFEKDSQEPQVPLSVRVGELTNKLRQWECSQG